MAHVIFDEIVSRCDYGIDLHTAAVRRTNYPNVRGDLSNPAVRRLAESFGCEFIMNGKGPGWRRSGGKPVRLAARRSHGGGRGLEGGAGDRGVGHPGRQECAARSGNAGYARPDARPIRW